MISRIRCSGSGKLAGRRSITALAFVLMRSNQAGASTMRDALEDGDGRNADAELFRLCLLVQPGELLGRRSSGLAEIVGGVGVEHVHDPSRFVCAEPVPSPAALSST